MDTIMEIEDYLDKEGLDYSQSENLITVKLPKYCKVLFDPSNSEGTIKVKFGFLDFLPSVLLGLLIYMALLYISINSGDYILIIFILWAVYWDISRYRNSKEVVAKIHAFYN